MTLTAGPEAGWYPDPAGDRAWRWWDGLTWTDHVRAREIPADAQPSAPESAPVPVVEAPVVADAVVPEPAAEPAAVVPEPAAEPAAEPAPVAEPAVASDATGSPGGIPQPGDVAPPPAPAASAAPASGSVSMTPPIPVTDQMYWHSSAAEVIEVPRVASASRQPTPRPAGAVPSYIRDWNDLGSPHTAGIWLLAFSPILGWGAFVAVAQAMSVASLPPIVGLLAGAAASLLLHWAFAALDARALAARGYHAPRVAWMLLFPPLAYLIARGKAVRRETKAAWQPELVYILSNVIVVGGLVALWALAMALLMSMGVVS